MDIAELKSSMDSHTAAMVGLTSALLKQSGNSAVPAAADLTVVAPGAGKRQPGRPRRVTLNDVKAVAERVRDERDRDTAVALIKEHGANTLAELEESKYAAFIAACEVVLNETQGGEADL